MHLEQILPTTVLSSTDVTGFNNLLSQLSDHAPMLTGEQIIEITGHSTILLTFNDDGVIVGTATLAILHKPMGLEGHLEDLVVDESFRKRGIGTALIEQIIKLARAQRLPSLHFTSRPSREAANLLYEKMGFVKRETNVWCMHFDT